MSQILLYHHQSTRQMARRIQTALTTAWGYSDDDIFVPDGNTPAEDLSNAILRADVMLILIGANWVRDLRQRGAAHLRILNNALDATRLLVIPILVDRATMPTEQQLPPALSKLTTIAPVTISDGQAFDSQIAELTQHMPLPSRALPTITPADIRAADDRYKARYAPQKSATRVPVWLRHLIYDFVPGRLADLIMRVLHYRIGQVLLGGMTLVVLVFVVRLVYGRFIGIDLGDVRRALNNLAPPTPIVEVTRTAPPTLTTRPTDPASPTPIPTVTIGGVPSDTLAIITNTPAPTATNATRTTPMTRTSGPPTATPISVQQVRFLIDKELYRRVCLETDCSDLLVGEMGANESVEVICRVENVDSRFSWYQVRYDLFQGDPQREASWFDGYVVITPFTLVRPEINDEIVPACPS